MDITTTDVFFNIEHESMLMECLLKVATLNYGLRTDEVRSLAYEYAMKLYLKIPTSWEKHKKSGKDWVYSLDAIKRYR